MLKVICDGSFVMELEFPNVQIGGGKRVYAPNPEERLEMLARTPSQELEGSTTTKNIRTFEVAHFQEENEEEQPRREDGKDSNPTSHEDFTPPVVHSRMDCSNDRKDERHESQAKPSRSMFLGRWEKELPKFHTRLNFIKLHYLCEQVLPAILDKQDWDVLAEYRTCLHGLRDSIGSFRIYLHWNEHKILTARISTSDKSLLGRMVYVVNDVGSKAETRREAVFQLQFINHRIPELAKVKRSRFETLRSHCCELLARLSCCLVAHFDRPLERDICKEVTPRVGLCIQVA